jgi:diguanylate cyclase (GGDEF)-like protein/PAS domain S-box-containing protein
MSSDHELQVTNSTSPTSPSNKGDADSIQNQPSSPTSSLFIGLEEAIDQTGSYIYIKDLEGRYVYANNKVRKLFNVSLNGIVGKDDRHFFKFLFANDLRKDDLLVITHGDTIEKEETLWVKSIDENRIFWVVKKPIKNNDGQIIGLCGVSTDITERKRTEQQLRETSEELNESQTIAGLGTYVLDVGAGVWKSSFVLDQIFGIDESYQRSVIGWESIIHIDDRAMMRDYFLTDVIGKKLKFDKEYRITRINDNSVRWLHGLGKLDFDKNGIPVKMHGTIQDITERKLNEIALRESETFLRLSQTVNGISYWEEDLLNNKLKWSENCISILGFPPIDLPTRNDFLGLVHQDDRKIMIDAMKSHIEHGTKFDVEYRAINKSGDIRWMRSTGQSEHDLNGQPIKMRGIGQDITQQRKLYDALSKSEDKYRKAFDTSIDAINITRMKDGIYLDINQAFVHIIGYQRDEIIGHSSLELNIWFDPNDRNRMIELIKNDSICRNFEARFRCNGGRVIWGLMSASMIEIDGVACILSMTRDITERKLAEEEQRIAAIAFESQEGMLVTDANSLILRVNSAFSRITGYAAEEVIGKNPRILSSERQDAKFYSAMWDSIIRLGYWEGEIWNKRKNGEIYPEKLTITTVKNSAGIVTNYVATLTDITLSREAAEEIQHLAFYDSLTRLPNRRLLIDRLKLAFATSSRTGKKGALLFLDLDNFKTLNDTLGHDVGDQLLQQTAQRIESCLREGDTVARQGGDEFVVMLEGLNENLLEAAAQTEAIGTKILEEFNLPYQLAGHAYRNTTSIGAVLFSNHELGIDELLKQADIAMYQAKKEGRNTLRFFDPEMQASINARAALENELHSAIDKKQFQLYYQIQVGNSLRPVGAEALIRWNHYEKGIVSPAQFVPLAEETGQILAIGHWVLDTACSQLKSWRHDARTRDLTLSVNVSAKQFHESDFVSQVQDAVQRHSIDPRLLKLEPTESILLEDIEETVKTMNALKEIGVHFSLDDFGTGFSSLQYLKRLPLDQLKIDQSFVRDLVVDSNDQAIVRTIIAMAQSLNLDVIAEGVETEQQLLLLQENGCNHYQGYLFGKPVPIEEFEASLRKS